MRIDKIVEIWCWNFCFNRILSQLSLYYAHRSITCQNLSSFWTILLNWKKRVLFSLVYLFIWNILIKLNEGNLFIQAVHHSVRGGGGMYYISCVALRLWRSTPVSSAILRRSGHVGGTCKFQTKARFAHPINMKLFRNLRDYHHNHGKNCPCLVYISSISQVLGNPVSFETIFFWWSFIYGHQLILNPSLLRMNIQRKQDRCIGVAK